MTGYTNLYLYKNTKFYKHQNYKIDNLNQFLATLQLDKLTFENLQYFRPDSITKELKIVFNQKGIKALHQYNYARVEIYNTDGTMEWELFYFVDRIEWISMDCIKLHMTCDTLNSFLDSLEFHPKTFVEREHIDRWNYDGCFKNESESRLYILRNIPELNEGLNPQQYAYHMEILPNLQPSYEFVISSGKTSMKIYDGNDLFADDIWILAYLTERQGTEENPSIIRQVISYPRNYTFYIKDGDTTRHTTQGVELDITSNDNQKLLAIPYPIHNDMVEAYYKYDQEHPYQPDSESDLSVIAHKYTNQDKHSYGVGFSYNNALPRDLTETTISNYTAHFVGSGLLNRRSWKDVCKSLFICNFIYTDLIDDIIDNGFFKNLPVISNNNYSNESAMYSSEFFSLKFSYGDCSYTLALEDYKWNNNYELEEILSSEFVGNPYITITFSISRLIDSNVYFRFSRDLLINAFSIERKEDNGDLMIVPLSSQVPLTSDEYLSYMRNGYNYDIKIRDVSREERQEMHKWDRDISMLGGMIGINPLRTLRTGIIGIERDLQFDQQERYTQLKENLEMEKNISMMKGSKIGIDQINGGIDKYKTLSNEKLSFSFMLPRKSWWKYLEDYFYFFGCKVQYYGVPTHNNRALFDYLKCNAEFVNRNNVPNNEALQDIIQRLKNGTTFVHKYLNQWTFDSDYKENVENRLLEIIQGE